MSEIATPVWIVFALFVAGVVGMMLVARRWRVAVRDEFVEYLRETRPTLEVVGMTAGSLELRTADGGRAAVNLARLVARIAEEKARTPEERAPHFERFASAIDQWCDAGKSDPEADRARLRPRLLLPDDARAMAAPLAGSAGAELVVGRIESLGLDLTYVLDSPNSVAYLSRKYAEELGLDDAALRELALTNLRGSVPEEMIREVVDGGKAVILSGRDGHDAARILLVPELLGPGEAVLCAIPDVDRLFLAPWDPARWTPDACAELVANIGSGGQSRPLLDRAVKVTREGFELVR